MDKNQASSSVKMLQEVAGAEGMCKNLVGRLKLAQAELKANKEWKPVGDAADAFRKPVEAALSEIMSIFKNYPDKKREAMEMAEFKKKTDKMMRLLGSASDAASAYWSAYKKSFDVNAKIGGCTSANASFGYAAQLVKSATASKINYNQMK